MLLELLIKFNTEILPLIYRLLFIVSPVIVPIVLAYIAVLLYVRSVQLKYISKLKPFLYEIKIPKDIQKSPLAMEIILGSMQGGGAPNYSEAYLDGRVKPWFSLELVSIEGEVRFFVWASEQKFKKVIESQIYAQYPTVEVHEVPPEKDYVRHFNFDPDIYSVWGTQFKLTKKDVYPIRTYVDYSLDKDQKDEYRIDPMTAVLEYLGSAGKGQQIWIQILIKPHGKEGLKNHRLKEKGDWKKDAQKEIKNIKVGSMLDIDPEKVSAKDIKKANESMKFPNMTKGQMETIAAIERELDKPSFDTMIRGLYLTEKDKFNSSYISGLSGSMRQYSSANLNGFKLGAYTDVSDEFKDWATIFPFLKKIIAKKKAKYTREIYNAYRLRSFFFPPYQNYRQNPFILNTEELATIYHFPGNVSATPTLPKIASKKSEPPPNLPIKK